MSVADRQALARHADLSRPMEPSSVFHRAVKPRRALAPVADGSRSGPKARTRVGRTAVGVIAGAAVAGGLALANPTQAAAHSIGHDLPKLHEGARNSLVVRLQRELSANGRNVPDTGYYGSITKSRVKQLQRHHGWKATGVVGSRVWHVLLSDGHRVGSPSIKPYQGGHKHSHHKKKHHSGGSSAGRHNTVWDKLAQCESGGNWHINTGNGFYGGLQFTLSTWHAYGGSGMPNHHSRANQIHVARKVQSAQGWGAWPACSAKIGLR